MRQMLMFFNILTIICKNHVYNLPLNCFQGEKIFYLIEPTEENLKKYGQWVSSSDQVSVFFGEKVDKCYKLHMKSGNTLLIPTGE